MVDTSRLTPPEYECVFARAVILRLVFSYGEIRNDDLNFSRDGSCSCPISVVQLHEVCEMVRIQHNIVVSTVRPQAKRDGYPSAIAIS